MVAIIRRNPSRALTLVEPFSVADEVEMLARDLWEGWEPVTFGTSLPLNLYELKDELVMKVELPGFKREDIDISLEGQLLTIKAERKQEDVEKDTTYPAFPISN